MCYLPCEWLLEAVIFYSRLRHPSTVLALKLHVGHVHTYPRVARSHKLSFFPSLFLLNNTSFHVHIGLQYKVAWWRTWIGRQLGGLKFGEPIVRYEEVLHNVLVGWKLMTMIMAVRRSCWVRRERCVYRRHVGCSYQWRG